MTDPAVIFGMVVTGVVDGVVGGGTTVGVGTIMFGLLIRMTTFF